MQYEEREQLLSPGYLPFESGVIRHEDGFVTVGALTRMPHCRAKMVDWWFGWLGGTDQYKLWHPRDHVFSDWENRENGNYINASHLVHEYLGGQDGPLFKLRINFRDPTSFFSANEYRASGAMAVCARIGLLDEPIDLGYMTHFVRDTDFGCEMRSRFWLGHIDTRGDVPPMDEGATKAMRAEALGGDFPKRLHQHAIEEMGYLADLLPVFYRQVTGDATF